MNAKQEAGSAKKPEEKFMDPFIDEVITPKGGREKIPGGYEEKYRSENLKKRIADFAMWAAIPSVTCNMNSQAGIKRLKENDALFTFIDQYFQDIPFAFEPNMRDGRFVFLPHDVSHQGIGICASKAFPGFLEVGHFWYPREYTDNSTLNIDQVYIPQYTIKPGLIFADQIRRLYTESPNSKERHYCTFPFDLDTILRLDGNFMDHLDQTTQAIRTALKNRSPQVQKNGEGLILFMQRLMRSK